MARAASAAKGGDSPIVNAIEESCVLLDGKGIILAHNEAFADSFLTDKGGAKARFEFAKLGSSAVDALSRAAGGHFVETDAYFESDGILEGWRAAFVPQGQGKVLMVLRQEAQDYAFFDALTGLPNRLVALERLGREWERWLRSKGEAYSFGVALADIDHFKRINDRYGHDTGDQALKQVSDWFEGSLRGGDWVARWGGEEFLLFFHDVNRDGAMTAAERCREAVCSDRFHSDTGLSFAMSVSMGVVVTADYDVSAKNSLGVHQMINDADVLLYDAKHEGRNRSQLRTGTDWLQLTASEINAMLREGKLEAIGRPVQDAEGRQSIGTFWQPRVSGMEHRAARHLFQSAIRHNLISSVEARWMNVCRGADGADLSEQYFVVVNPNTMQRLSSQRDVHEAARRFAMEGKKLVLVAKYDPMFGDHGKETHDALADLNIKSCLWLPRYPTVPTGLLSQLRPSYVMIDEPFTDMETTFFDLLRIVREYDTTLILNREMIGREISYPSIYYIDSYGVPKA